MTTKAFNGFFLSCTLLFLLFAPDSNAARDPRKPELPGPLGYVSDHAGVVDGDWKSRIRSVCQDLERKTGVEMVVVTVPELKPFGTVQAYADALYKQWGIGTAQQDHGILVVAVIRDQQAAVTLGRSLVAVISPKVLEKIGGDYLRPVFRNGKYGEGLYRTSVALASATQDIRIGDPPRKRAKWLAVSLTLGTGFGALWFLWWISRPDLRHPYGRLRRGEYWGTGQGGFGGNFGGFGGGGSGEGLK